MSERHRKSEDEANNYSSLPGFAQGFVFFFLGLAKAPFGKYVLFSRVLKQILAQVTLLDIGCVLNFKDHPT